MGSPWLLVKGENLNVLGPQPAAELRDMAILLEQFRAAVAIIIPSARHLSVPTNVYVFETRKDLEPFVPLYKGKPVAVAGYFQGDADATYIAVSASESRNAVFHEYAHMLQQNAMAAIPLWLNEGLAEYFSTFRLRRGDERAEIGRAVDSHVALLRDRFLPFNELLTATRASALYNEGDRRSVFYAQAWATVHYIMADVPDGPAAINRYVEEVRRSESVEQAFTRVFGDPVAFGKRVQEYVRRFAFRAYDFPARFEIQEPEGARTIDPGELDARLGDLQLRVQRVAEAAPRIEQAVSRNPAVAYTHLALGQLRLDQHRGVDALDALRRAAALDARDYATQYAYGVALLQHEADAMTLGVVDSIVVAREALQRAVQINPYASDAFSWLSASYARRQEWGSARAALEHAAELAPGRLDYSLRLADLDLLEGHLAEAKARLAGIAAADPSSAIAHTAGGRLAQLDAGPLGAPVAR
jgi:tetratricopeptide (TPR) repeat protein